MTEYIERQEALRAVCNGCNIEFDDQPCEPGDCYIRKKLMEVTSADVAPVRHGRWRCHGDCGVTECSVCGWSIEEYVGDYAYCPNCGARMDGGAD